MRNTTPKKPTYILRAEQPSFDLPDNVIQLVKSQLPEDDWKKMLDTHVAAFNKVFASVIIGGKHQVMKEVIHDGRVTYEFYARKELALLYDNSLIQIGKNDYANHLLAWAKHPKARTYPNGVVFLPGRTTPYGCFNMWQGFSVTPKQNDALLEPVFYHMREIICDENQELCDYLTKWIAFGIQHPDFPAGTAIVLRGEKGSGKGVFGHFLKKQWGSHGLHIANPKHLTGNFNAHLGNVCFLFVDEAFFSGDKAHEGVLKALITEPVIVIEAKYFNAVSQPNYLKVLMATNADFAVPASSDERRYCVFDVSSKRIGDREYFKALDGVFGSKEVQAAFLHYMQHVDLTGWHSGNVPESVGLRAQRGHSFKAHQKWLLDCLSRGSFNVLGQAGNPDVWDDELTSEDLFKSYLAWCDEQRISEYGRISQTQLGRYLSGIYRQKKHAGGAKGKRGFVFGSVEEAVQSFEKHEKVSIAELSNAGTK